MLSLLAPTKYKELRFLDSVGRKETSKAYEHEMIEPKLSQGSELGMGTGELRSQTEVPRDGHEIK